MIRWFLLPALTLVIGGVVAARLREDPGYVLIQVAGYTIESSLAGLTLIAAVTVALSLIAIRLIQRSVRLPGQFGHFLQDRRLQQARRQLRLGLTQLAAGEWERAEVELLRRIADADEPGTNYLYAAEAAHRLNNPDRRDEYLSLADASNVSNHAAVLLKRAQVWADDGRHAEALEALDTLLATQPRNRPALTLRLELLAAEGRWEALKLALPAARGSVADTTLDTLALTAHRALLTQARSAGRLDSLRTAWREVPKPLQHDPELIAHYARLAHDLNADEDVLRIIAAELRQQWHPQLALAFGQLKGSDPVRQLAKVENWINQHGEKPELLLVAGRLCLRNRLWGRARSYFEACLRSYPSPEVRLELGKLLMQQGEDSNAALELFREGLETSLTPPKPAQEWIAAEDAARSLEPPR